jgi:hypothetical protein
MGEARRLLRLRLLENPVDHTIFNESGTEHERETEFAMLLGGGTLLGRHSRGVCGSLIARRASLAAAAGFRYHTRAPARAAGRSLAALAFVELATTTAVVRRQKLKQPSALRWRPVPRPAVRLI